MQNKKHLLRLIAVLLALLFVIPAALVACSDGEEEVTTAKTDGDVSTEPRLDSGIPDDFDYGGEVFTICTASDGWSCTDIWVEENQGSAGEPLYDAVINRNLILSDKYGVEIAICGSDAGDSAFTYIINSIQAADGQFQALTTMASVAVKLALNNYLIDYNTIDTLNTSNSWWDQEEIKQCTMNDKLYFLVGEYTNNDNGATHAIAFNKDMFKEFQSQLGDKTPYDYVREGTWTFDVLYNMCRVVGNDTDGNQKFDENDRYGLTYPQTAVYAFLGAGEVVLGKVDEGGEQLLVDTFWSDKTASYWDKIIDLVRQDWSFNWHQTTNWDYKSMFQNGQLLFLASYIDLLIDLRQLDVDCDFGIVPYPKYDEAQTSYHSPCHEYGTNFLCVPISNTDLDSTGYILEALSYESLYTLTEAYYETTLVGRLSRDNESKEMLELIYSTKLYDFGYICNWGNFAYQLMAGLFVNGNANLSSTYNSYKRAINRDIQRQLEYYGVDT